MKANAVLAILGFCMVSAGFTSAQPGPGGPGPQGMYGSRNPQGNMSMPGSMSPSAPPSSAFRGPTRFGSVPDTRGYNPGRSSAMQPFSPAGRGAMPPAGRGAMPTDTSRVQQALQQRDFETIGAESQAMRRKANTLPQMAPDMSVQDRLKVPLLQHKYRTGANIMEEGRNTRNESKIEYGIQHIEDANRRFGTMGHPGEHIQNRGIEGSRNNRRR